MSLDQVCFLIFMLLISAKDLMLECYVIGLLALVPLITFVFERRRF